MKRESKGLAGWLLAFGFGYAFFQVMVAFIPGGLAGPVRRADAFDFLTPFVVIPLALVVFSRIRRAEPGERAGEPGSTRGPRYLFVIALIIYVDGHGIHLSANAIDRLLEGQEGSALHSAVYLFDEVISHFVWDAGVVLIASALIWAASRKRFGLSTVSARAASFAGGLFFGFCFAVNAIEGQTVVFTFPAAVLGSLVCLSLYLKRRKQREFNPVVLFYLTGFVLSALLFAFWGISHAGFPEFSALGWI